MEETTIYLELSEDIEELLSENDISIEDILERENIEANVSGGVAAYQSEEGARTKDVVTIILAGSAAVAAISFAISQVLHEIYNKPHFVEICENEEIRDAEGNIMFDKDGKPQFKPVKRYELIEPQKKRELEFSVGLKNGVVIKVKSEGKTTQESLK